MAGELYEWVVLQELVKNNISDIKYWRTKSWIEVDFVVDNVSSLDVFEVKFKNKLKNTDFYWLKSFKEHYNKMIKSSVLIGKDRSQGVISVFDLLNYPD